MVLTCAIEAGAQQVCQAQEPADRDLRRRRHGDARRLRRRHPHRDLHAVPGGRHDRDQPGPPPRSLGHLQGQAAQGMERVVDRDRREEGIMPAVAWCAISTSIRCGPGWRRTSGRWTVTHGAAIAPCWATSHGRGKPWERYWGDSVCAAPRPGGRTGILSRMASRRAVDRSWPGEGWSGAPGVGRPSRRGVGWAIGSTVMSGFSATAISWTPHSRPRESTSSGVNIFARAGVTSIGSYSELRQQPVSRRGTC